MVAIIRAFRDAAEAGEPPRRRPTRTTSLSRPFSTLSATRSRPPIDVVTFREAPAPHERLGSVLRGPSAGSDAARHAEAKT